MNILFAYETHGNGGIIEKMLTFDKCISTYDRILFGVRIRK